MNLTDKQEKLFEYVTAKHGDQKRKYTGEPYVNHCMSVAKIVSEHEDNCVEIALCHDLFEDTDCNFKGLYNQLLWIGYGRDESYDICTCVTELTDEFTHEKYPYHNRGKRKVLEAKRLGKISYRSQSVKYADLIDNTSSIVAHDTGFAKVYLKEKERVLENMRGGNKDLLNKCLNSLEEAMQTLSINIQ